MLIQWHKALKNQGTMDPQDMHPLVVVVVMEKNTSLAGLLPTPRLLTFDVNTRAVFLSINIQVPASPNG